MTLPVMMVQIFLIAIVAVGGASATVPEMHRLFVENYHVLAGAEFADLYALSQSAPGPNVLFLALFGWRIHGLTGATFALLAFTGPTATIAVLAESFSGHYRESKIYRILKRALTPVAVGLLISTALTLIRPAASLKELALLPATFLILWVWNLNPLWCLGAAALLGGLGWLA